MRNILFSAILAVSNIFGVNEIDEKFPEPTPNEIESRIEEIKELGKNEVFSLSYVDLAMFFWDRYVRGPSDNFHYYGANPEVLTPRQAEMPATILVHSSMSNQGQWMPLLQSIEEQGGVGPVFTFNYQDGDELAALFKKIYEIRALYKAAGVDNVRLNLVGHSLGGICSADYGYSPELWVENTKVEKVIAIAARLKNIDNPADTPFYSYCVPVLKNLVSVWARIERDPNLVELYTIAAEKDWLVPKESVLVAPDEDHKAVVSGTGHVLVASSDETKSLVIKWIKNPR